VLGRLIAMDNELGNKPELSGKITRLSELSFTVAEVKRK
jgi:hypothetical protein